MDLDGKLRNIFWSCSCRCGDRNPALRDLDAKSFIIDYSFLLQLHSFAKVAEKEKKINTYEKQN